MIQRLRSGMRVVMAAYVGGLIAVCLCGCSDRDKTVGTSGVESPVSDAHVARQMAEAKKELEVAQDRLSTIKREFADDTLKLGRMQTEAVKTSPEIAAMEKEFLKERQAFVDRMNVWPGIREQIEKKAALMAQVKVLTDEREEIVARLKKAKTQEEKQLIGDELKALSKRFEPMREGMLAASKEIERLKADVRENDPEMRTWHAKLLEKHHLIYIGKVNQLPEIAKLRDIQEGRRKQMKSLEERIAGLRTRAGQDSGSDERGKNGSKELMING